MGMGKTTSKSISNRDFETASGGIAVMTTFWIRAMSADEDDEDEDEEEDEEEEDDEDELLE